MADIIKSAFLHFQQGTSDKVYNVEIIQNSVDSYNVRIGYGRRGNTLNISNKVSDVSLIQAESVFTKQVNEKIRKGYLLSEGNNLQVADLSATVIPVVKKQTKFGPQFLNEISEDEVEFFLKDPNYCMQEKHNGRRRGIIKESNNIFGTNKKAQAIELDKEVMKELETLQVNSFILDSEDVDRLLWLFDIHEFAGLDVRNNTYKERYKILCNNFVDKKYKFIKVVYTAFTEKEKRSFFKKLKKDGREGAVFKEINSISTPGKPASGGTHYKFKFYKTLSAISKGKNKGRRSIGLSLVDDECIPYDAGNVTIHPNKEIPKENDIVEIRYLYANKYTLDNGIICGILYQPEFLDLRDDVDEIECNLSQLKFKNNE